MQPVKSQTTNDYLGSPTKKQRFEEELRGPIHILTSEEREAKILIIEELRQSYLSAPTETAKLMIGNSFYRHQTQMALQEVEKYKHEAESCKKELTQNVEALNRVNKELASKLLDAKTENESIKKENQTSQNELKRKYDEMEASYVKKIEDIQATHLSSIVQLETKHNHALQTIAANLTSYGLETKKISDKVNGLANTIPLLNKQ